MSFRAPIQNIPAGVTVDDESITSSQNPASIDVTNPEDVRVSFRTTDYDSALAIIQDRFPEIDPLYLTKIFRGTIRAEGLVWLDVGRQDVTPEDFTSLAHLLYCFEVYGQVICIFAQPQGQVFELELQRALADYRLKLLQLSRVSTWESLREWHKAVLVAQFGNGQDRLEGWRKDRPELQGMLRRRRDVGHFTGLT